MSNYKQGALASLIISIIIFIIVFILIIAVSYNWRVNTNSNSNGNSNGNQLLAAAAIYNKNHFTTSQEIAQETEYEMQLSGEQGLYGYVNTI